MSERLSSFERVVGHSLSEEDKENILAEAEGRFADQAIAGLGTERAKTPEETRIIDYINRSTDKLRRAFGLSEFRVAPENIHIVPGEEWRRRGSDAVFLPMHQAVILKDTDVRVTFAKKVFHELIHFKSYGALQYHKERDGVSEYRCGLVVRPRGDTAGGFFVALNEGVTEELTKRLLPGVREDRAVAPEMGETERIRSAYPDAVDGEGNPFFTSDTYFVKEERHRDGKVALVGEDFTKKKERRVVEVLASKLFERNPGSFETKEAVFQEFVRAMFTGRISRLARLVDGSFGKGTFRRIGELDDDLDELERFVGSL